MSTTTGEHILFDVETSRVLQILSKEIYDSPMALLRENVQNAYDAILMRCVLEGSTACNGLIEIDIKGNQVTITDNGIGMTEEVLRQNFWKAGSSGKRSELASRSGVVGTFGIGAMANFGVATKLEVETRAVSSSETLISTAEREKLSIAKECIELRRLQDSRGPGTKVVAFLDSSVLLTEAMARAYLHQYIRFLPVPVRLNGTLLSQEPLERVLGERAVDGEQLPTLTIRSGIFQAQGDAFVDSSGNVNVKVTGVRLGEQPVQGELILRQNGAQLMGLRNCFGLAPVPVSGHYQFGGIANLSILQPTAGREALSRESIQHVNQLIVSIEAAVSEKIADTATADRNIGFQQYVLTSNQVQLARNLSVEVLPHQDQVPLAKVKDYSKNRTLYYYTGREQTIIQTFSSEQSFLLHVSQSNPRRELQVRYISQVLRIAEVPDRAIVTRKYSSSELAIEEAALLVRVVSTLNDDYLIPNVEVKFADISHGVSILVEKESDTVMIYLSRGAAAVSPVLNCYRTAYEVFGGFVKDFVRVQLYNKLSQYVPSTTKEGADALCRLLQRNRELYHYEDSELGELEPLLASYLTGDMTLGEVMRSAKHIEKGQTVTVRSDQIGQVEQAIPGVVDSPTQADPEESSEGREYQAAPAIMRGDLYCEMKILVAGGSYPQLNGLQLFLGLSDRLFKREGDFFRSPHTTKVIWAEHRVIFIFGHASARLTLYYDIELKDPLQERKAAGVMIPTTTLFTKNRIFVPVPPQLVADFKISHGSKEFFVRFDTLFS